MWDMGCYEISLGDTIGVGTPGRSLSLKFKARKEISVSLYLGLLQDP
jgi:isopropylmalate/homocitrate/citramalate synthase